MSERAFSERMRLLRIKYEALAEDEREARERARARAAEATRGIPLWWKRDDDLPRVESYQESIYPRGDF